MSDYRDYHVWARLPGERSWPVEGMNQTRSHCLDYYVREHGLPDGAIVYIVPSEHVERLRVTAKLEKLA